MSKELIERLEAEEADEAGMFSGSARVVPMAAVKPIIEKLQTERDAIAAELKALREQEPVAWVHISKLGNLVAHLSKPADPAWLIDGDMCVPRYAHPVPSRELTDEAIENLHMQIYKGPSIAPVRMLSFARAIERYLKGDGE